MICLFKSFAHFLICFLVEFRVSFIYSEYKSFARYVICIYILSVCGLSFHSLTVSSAAQKVLILMKFNLPTYGSLLVSCMSQNSLPNPRSSRCSKFSSVLQFYVLHLDQWIHLGLIFAEGLTFRSWFSFFFFSFLLSMDVQLFQTICWKDYPFSIESFFLTFIKNQLAVHCKLHTKWR